MVRVAIMVQVVTTDQDITMADSRVPDIMDIMVTMDQVQVALTDTIIIITVTTTAITTIRTITRKRITT